eukprot:gene19292-biopygen477
MGIRGRSLAWQCRLGSLGRFQLPPGTAVPFGCTQDRVGHQTCCPRQTAIRSPRARPLAPAIYAALPLDPHVEHPWRPQAPPPPRTGACLGSHPRPDSKSKQRSHICDRRHRARGAGTGTCVSRRSACAMILGTAVLGERLDISEQRLLHHVREASRRRLLREVAERRSNDFDGVQNGVDRLATMALYSLQRTSTLERAYLRSTLIGTRLWSTAEFWARSEKDAAVRAVRGACTFCSTAEFAGQPHAGEVETIEHLFWQCPAWARVRQQPRFRFLQQLRPLTWPACLRRCGVMPAHVPGLEERAALEAAAAPPQRRALPRWLFRALRANEVPAEGLLPADPAS